MARRKPVARKAARSSTALVRRESAHALPPVGPFEFVQRLTDEMDRVFHPFGIRWTTSPFDLLGRPLGWAPQVDVFERGGTFVVRADVPGLGPKDIKVEVTDDAVVIEGERKHQHEEARGHVYRHERSVGRFYRTIPLPRGVKADEARATFRNGVLEIVMPAPGLGCGRRVEIEGE